MKISVIAHPNSKNPRVEKDLLESLHVYVKEPPMDGEANKAIIKALSNYFNQKPSKVKLISGFKSKAKIFEIS